MADATTLRASFLREAAYLLAFPSPAAAAILGSARDRVIDETELEVPAKESAALGRETCRACGNLMIPGWSCKIASRSQGEYSTTKNTSKNRNKPKNSTRVNSSLVYTCLRCNRDTAQMLPSQPRRHLKSSKIVSTTEVIQDIGQVAKLDVERISKTPNSNSKQRQKARKGGLQAMLEKNKAQNSSQGGLDLMDFAM